MIRLATRKLQAMQLHATWTVIQFWGVVYGALHLGYTLLQAPTNFRGERLKQLHDFFDEKQDGFKLVS